MRAMHSEARWVQELYPVDEMLARKLNLPLEKITLNEIEPPASGATYRVHAFDAAGKEILAREFKVATRHAALQRRDAAIRTGAGGNRLGASGGGRQDHAGSSASRPISKSSGTTTRTRRCRSVYQFVMSQAHGELRAEYLPPFDTLTLDIHMSEPDYSLDLDKERISTLEALQEDTFYSTARLSSA